MIRNDELPLFLLGYSLLQHFRIFEIYIIQ